MMHAFNLANSYSYTEQPTLMFELVGASKVMVGAFYSRSGTLPVLLSPPLAPIPTPSLSPGFVPEASGEGVPS